MLFLEVRGADNQIVNRIYIKNQKAIGSCDVYFIEYQIIKEGIHEDSYYFGIKSPKNTGKNRLISLVYEELCKMQKD